jgi:hypothetical protein
MNAVNRLGKPVACYPTDIGMNDQPAVVNFADGSCTYRDVTHDRSLLVGIDDVSLGSERRVPRYCRHESRASDLHPNACHRMGELA